MPKLTKNDVEFMLREIDFILKSKDLPSCPDPYEGGCIGYHCIKCAAKELRGFAKSFEEELK
jgi:hypothetical protein